MSLYLQLHVAEGTKSARDTISEAIAVANRLQIPVRFQWSHTEVRVHPDDDLDALYKEFEKARKAVGLNTLATLHR